MRQIILIEFLGIAWCLVIVYTFWTQESPSLPCCLSEGRYLWFFSSSSQTYGDTVFFILGDSPASKFYMPRFRSTLSVPSSYVLCSLFWGVIPRRLNFTCRRFGSDSVSKRRHIKFRSLGITQNKDCTRPMKMEQAECSEIPARKIQTPGNHPK